MARMRMRMAEFGEIFENEPFSRMTILENDENGFRARVGQVWLAAVQCAASSCAAAKMEYDCGRNAKNV